MPKKQTAQYNGDLMQEQSSLSTLVEVTDCDLERATDPKTRELEDLVSQIDAAGDGSIDALWKKSKLCARANELLNSEDKKAFGKRLKCGQSKFSKYVTMGNKSKLWTPEVQEYLPDDRVSSVYMVARWEDDEIDAAMAGGILHRQASYAQLKAYGNGASNRTDPKLRPIGSLRADQNMTAAEQQAIENDLKVLLSRHPRLRINFKGDTLADAGKEWLDNRDKYIFEAAAAIIQTRLGNLPRPQRKQLKAALQPITKETPIDIDIARANLEIIGLSSQFERLKEEAEERVNVPRVIMDLSMEEQQAARHREQQQQAMAKLGFLCDPEKLGITRDFSRLK
jgi:hypothetical protein